MIIKSYEIKVIQCDNKECEEIIEFDSRKVKDHNLNNFLENHKWMVRWNNDGAKYFCSKHSFFIQESYELQT